MTTIDDKGDLESVKLSMREDAILQIAAHGESIAAIGDHEGPINRLVNLGLMRRIDKFNNVITPEGRKLMAKLEEGVDKSLTEMVNLLKEFHNLKDGQENPFLNGHNEIEG